VSQVSYEAYHYGLELLVVKSQALELHLKLEVLARYNVYGPDQGTLLRLRTSLFQQVLQAFLVYFKVDSKVLILLLLQVELPFQIFDLLFQRSD
jgi:hypothetical protein